MSSGDKAKRGGAKAHIALAIKILEITITGVEIYHRRRFMKKVTRQSLPRSFLFRMTGRFRKRISQCVLEFGVNQGLDIDFKTVPGKFGSSD